MLLVSLLPFVANSRSGMEEHVPCLNAPRHYLLHLFDKDMRCTNQLLDSSKAELKVHGINVTCPWNQRDLPCKPLEVDAS